jgi:hypothetical protein
LKWEGVAMHFQWPPFNLAKHIAMQDLLKYTSMLLTPFSSIPAGNKTTTAQLAFRHSHTRLLTSFGSFKTVKRYDQFYAEH